MKNQLKNCKVKDVIVDEAFHRPPGELQLTVAPSSPLQSSDAQASLALSAQEDLPTPNADGRSVVSAHRNLRV